MMTAAPKCVNAPRLTELSLFSGAGGGLLGTTHLLGFKTIGMVEIDAYCQKILRQRQDDGYLDRCPIFSDIRDFNSSGTARLYRGVTDVITAGFPCQPFSTSAHGNNTAENLWPETAETIRVVRPRYVFLENVQGVKRYLPVVRADLHRMDFSVPSPAIAGASSVGAPHPRSRFWIFAHSNSNGKSVQPKHGEMDRNKATEKNFRCDWWDIRPDIPRMDDGISFRVDRSRACGQAQVPAVVELAWKVLTS